jgi:hypothetical protein
MVVFDVDLKISGSAPKLLFVVVQDESLKRRGRSSKLVQHLLSRKYAYKVHGWMDSPRRRTCSYLYLRNVPDVDLSGADVTTFTATPRSEAGHHICGMPLDCDTAVALGAVAHVHGDGHRCPSRRHAG